MAKARTWRRYRGWIAAGVLVVIAAAAFFAFKQSKAATPTETYQTEQVSTGTLSVTVSGTGNLAIDGTTDVYPDTAGTVASIAIAEGTAVSTGTVLFRLDEADAEANTASALSSYRRAQQSVAQAEAQLVKAENTLADLEDRYASQSTAAITTAASSAATGAAGTTATQATTVTSGDIEAAEADVASAEASLAAAQAERTTASLAYEDAQAAEDDLAVTTPTSGIVYTLNVEVGDSVSTSGGSSSGSGSTGASTGGAATGGATTTSASSSSSAPVVIAPTQPLALVLAINEVDLPSLEVGQRADIEFDALPDLTATGKVIEIADEGTVSSGVVTYDVTLSLDVADPALRSGMSSAATIVTAIAKDAVLVSNAAVKSNTDGSSYVLVMEDGATTPTQVTVETGLSSSTQTQIVSGLEVGQTVVTQTTSSSSSDSSSESGSSGRSGIMMPGMGGGPGAPGE